ncbi:hypothetical protein PSSHI_44960 [Photobacterium sp. R1]
MTNKNGCIILYASIDNGAKDMDFNKQCENQANKEFIIYGLLGAVCSLIFAFLFLF